MPGAWKSETSLQLETITGSQSDGSNDQLGAGQSYIERSLRNDTPRDHDSYDSVAPAVAAQHRPKEMESGAKRPTVIALFGQTGTGKTSFIKAVTGEESLEVGHSLSSCTCDHLRIHRK